MSDEIDRIVVLDDEKKRVLDLQDMDLPPPEVGIYDGTVRYYKANLEWAKFIEGHVSWLASTAAWKDAEDEGYHAIQQISIFLEGVEVATTEEICAAIECGFVKLASRIVSGSASGFSVDEDGNVTVGSGTDGTGSEALPDDDEATPWDESAAAYMGGAIAVKQGLKSFYDRLDTLYGTVNGTPVNTAAFAKTQINSYYPTDPTIMSASIDDYYTYRGTKNRHQFNPLIAFDLYLFCKGATARSFSRWLIDLSGFAADKITQMQILANGLTDEFYSEYLTQGIKVPSLDYPQSQCYPTPDEEWEFDMSLSNDVAYILTNSLKGGHRYQFAASGTFVDADVPNVVKDAFWSHDLVTGIKTFENMTWSIGGITAPTATKIPFSADHVYVFTIDKDNTGNTNGGTITKTNGAFTQPNVTGIIEMALKDLGEYAI